MKKLFTLLLALTMVLSFAACSNDNTQPTEPNHTTGTEAPTDPTQAPADEPTVAPTAAPTEAPTEEPTEAPTEARTEAPTGAPTVATEEPTEPILVPTEEPTTVPTEESTTSPATKPVVSDNDSQEAAAFVSQYLGRWYLEGHSDVYVDFSLDEHAPNYLNFSSYNFHSLEGGRTPRYTAYPAKYCLENGMEDYIWVEMGCEGSGFPCSTIKILKEHLELNGHAFGEGYVTFGKCKFVREQGMKTIYEGTCYPEALGTWCLDNDPNFAIFIFVISEHDAANGGDYIGIYSTNFDIETLSTGFEYSSHLEGWACLTSFWDQYGITVTDGVLTVTNKYGTKRFSRYEEDSIEPQETEPVATKPPETQPPTEAPTTPPTAKPTTTNPPATKAPVTTPPETQPKPPATEKPTTPPATEPPAVDVLIISDTQTISNQTIDTDVYITSTGVATFENVTVNGNIYCYGQLECSSCVANNVYAYAYGSMMSCGAYDGTHGKISGGIRCDTLKIRDDALDYAFDKWGKK